MGSAVLERSSGISHGYPELVSGSNEIASPFGNLRARNDRLLEQKTFLARNLEEEIDHIQKNWQQEGLPENWVDLPNVGFMLGYQMGFLDSEKLKQLSFRERVGKWTKLTASSIKSWIMEYVARRGALAGLQTHEIENGQIKYRDELHGAGFELKETLSKKEANGLVWDVYINTMMPFFANGEKAINWSPSGQRMPDQSGHLLNYTDSRDTLSEKRGNYIFTYTICNDLDIEEHAELVNELQKLGVQDSFSFTKDSTAEDFIAHPTLFNNSDVTVNDFIDAMGKVREKRGKKYIYLDKTVDDLKEESKSWEAMWEYDEVTKRFVKEFVDFSLSGNWTKETMQEALAVTILRSSKYVRAKEREKRQAGITYYGQNQLHQYTNSSNYTYASSNGGYGDVLKDMQTIAGCAGGGKKNSTPFNSSFNASYASFFGGEKDKRILCCTCPECDQQVEAVIENETITCNECGASAPYYETAKN